MGNVVLTHGILTDGRDIDRLRPALMEDYASVLRGYYDWSFLVRVRLCNHALSTMMAGLVLPGTDGVAHSNGCAIQLEAARLGAPFRNLVFVNPALDADVDVPETVQRLIVLYTPHDTPTRVAKYLLWHPWGDMGRKGYRGRFSNVWNVNMATAIPHAPVIGHSGVFESPDWLLYIRHLLRLARQE